jgi:hypothetical protein
MNAAAEEIVQALGPAFTRTLDRHFPTAIAAAASLAGSVLLREAESDAQTYPATQGRLTDTQGRQVDLLIFVQIFGSAIDPAIERCIKPGAGLKSYGWGEELPPAHSPLFDVDTMIGRLQDLPQQLTGKHGITPIFRAHIPALAAMKLICAGHKLRLLDEKAGKALARLYMAAGCRTEPVPIRG